MPKTAKELVIVIWSTKEQLEKGVVHVLDSYTGTRVYEKDRVDGRLGETPYFSTYDLAKDWMMEHPNKPVQIPLAEGKKYGLD